MEEGIPVCNFPDVLDLERVFLSSGVTQRLLKCCGKNTCVKRGVYDVGECGYN